MNFIFCCFRHMLRLELAKAIATFQINTPKIIKIQRIMETGKKLNLVLKAHYAGILQKQFCRTGNQHPRFWLTLKMSTLKYVHRKSFVQNKTTFKFGTNNALSGYLKLEFEKICYILRQHFGIFQNVKFCPKQIVFIFANKKALFDCFSNKTKNRPEIKSIWNEFLTHHKRNSVYIAFRCGRNEMKFRFRGGPRKAAHWIKAKNSCFVEINACADVSFRMISFWVMFTWHFITQN